MKKLITTETGGMPFFLNDLRYLESGIYDALLALGRSLTRPGSSATILYGCAFTLSNANRNLSVAPGMIYFNDGTYEHILTVDQVHLIDEPADIVIAKTGSVPRWNFTTVTDPDGNKTFYNGSTKSTYKVYKAQLVIDNDDTLPSLAESIRHTEFVQPSLLSGFSHQSSSEMKYCIKDGYLQFVGDIYGQSGDVFTLPEWARPVRYYNQHVHTHYSSSVWCSKSVNVATTGVVSISSQHDGEGVTPATPIPMNFIVPLF